MRKFFILFILLLAGCSNLNAPASAPAPAAKKIESVLPFGSFDNSISRLTFVYGDRPASVKECTPSWGLVILLEYDGRKILFNAGGSEKLLKNNMEALKINPKELDAVVISHHHWEMVDGLGYLLKEKPDLPVYTTDMTFDAASVPSTVKNFVVVKDKVWLTPNVLIMNLRSPRFEGGPTGIPEVHLVAKTSEGLVVLQGCGHPGIINIAKKSVEETGDKRVYMIAGGTRLLLPGKIVTMPDGTRSSIPQQHRYTEDEYRWIAGELLSMGVKKIIPTHCTCEAEPIFKEKFQENYINQTLGMVVEIPKS